MRKTFYYLMAMPLVFALAAPAQTAGSSTGSSSSQTSNTGATTDNASQGTTSGSTGTAQGTTSTTQGTNSTQGSTSGSMSSDSGMNNSGKKMKGEKAITGCIRSDNGNYMLEEKNGKMAKLNSSQDLSAHVGHTVKVHGTWQKGSEMGSNASTSNTTSGSMSSNSASSTNPGANSSGSNPSSSNTTNSTAGSSGSTSGKMKWDHKNQAFNVDSVDMVSDTCQVSNTGTSKY